MPDLLRWGLALVVFAHGVGHLLFLAPAVGLGNWAEQTGESWALTGAIGEAATRVIATVLRSAVIVPVRRRRRRVPRRDRVVAAGDDHRGGRPLDPRDCHVLGRHRVIERDPRVDRGRRDPGRLARGALAVGRARELIGGTRMQAQSTRSDPGRHGRRGRIP